MLQCACCWILLGCALNRCCPCSAQPWEIPAHLNPTTLPSADAQEIGLCSGLPAFLVQVPATGVHSNKYEQPTQQLKAAREEAAKRHTQAALAAQQTQQRAGGSVQLVQQARAAVQEAAAAAAAAPKSAADKKDE